MSKALFSDSFKDLSSEELSQLTDGLVVVEKSEDVPLLDALIETKLASSKREAREFVKNGAVKVNGEKITDLDAVLKKVASLNGYLFIKRGKRNYAVIKY